MDRVIQPKTVRTPAERLAEMRNLPQIQEVEEEKGVLSRPVEPPPGPLEEKPVSFIVVRDTVYFGIPYGYLQANGLHLDGDVYLIEASGQGKQIHDNRHRFITEKNYVCGSKAIGAQEIDAVSTAELNSHLQRSGKIPAFLELRYIEASKRMGIFAVCPIAPQTLLGLYQGLIRPVRDVPNKKWSRELVDFKGDVQGLIDAENITFANWTRFVYIGANEEEKNNANCSFSSYNYNVMLFCNKLIPEGTELVVPQ